METALEKMNANSNADSMEQFEKYLMTSRDPPLDILIRTSGETRLSDFMLWQTTKGACIHFIDVLWPDFGFLDFARIIISYALSERNRE